MAEKLQYVDGIKGFAILSVILLHALPKEFLPQSFAYVHIWQAVPLFVFVSFFLIYRKMEHTTLQEYYGRKNRKKLFYRIVLPFLILQCLFILLLLFKGNVDRIYQLFMRGGLGKGSYYPYLYLQIWLVAPLAYKMLKKTDIILGGGIFILITLFFNRILLDVPSRVYSCLVVRYLFMSVVAYVWYLNQKNVIWIYLLPVISIAFWIELSFDAWRLKSLFPGWSTQQFPAFFYTLFAVHLIYTVYTKTRYSIAKNTLEWLGQNSYEIFLAQMFFFEVFNPKKKCLEKP